MTNTIIYIDISGSVTDFLNYWNKVDEIVSLNKDAFFVVWDTEIKEISYK